MQEDSQGEELPGGILFEKTPVWRNFVGGISCERRLPCGGIPGEKTTMWSNSMEGILFEKTPMWRNSVGGILCEKTPV